MTATQFHAASHTTNRIRPLSVGRDMPQVMRLLNQVFTASLDVEGRRALNNIGVQPAFLYRLQRIGSKVAAGFVWDYQGQIVGNVSIIPTIVPDRVIIANVAVLPDYRRRGIAQSLMETTLNHLDSRGINTVMLQVDVDNEGAIRLYRALGFDVMGSTTYWLASPSQWREISTNSTIDIRPLPHKAHCIAYDLDVASFPAELNWPDPIHSDLYKSTWWKSIDNFLNGRGSESWVIWDGAELVALGSIWSEWGRAHRMSVRVAPEWRDQLTRPMMAKLVRRLSYIRRRYVSIEHQMEDELMHQLLKVANFSPKRNLMTMKLVL